MQYISLYACSKTYETKAFMRPLLMICVVVYKEEIKILCSKTLKVTNILIR